MLLVDAFTKTDAAIYLGIYASVVSTAAGLWALFSGVFRDRARIKVKAHETYLVNTTKGTMVVKGEDTLAIMGITEPQREVLHITVRNRGRRKARIETVSKVRWTGSWIFGDLAGQVPFDLLAETSETLVLGAEGGHRRGQIGRRGFYAVDGAGRIHPLRYRYLLRLTLIAYRWAMGLYWERRRRQMRQG